MGLPQVAEDLRSSPGWSGLKTRPPPGAGSSNAVAGPTRLVRSLGEDRASASGQYRSAAACVAGIIPPATGDGPHRWHAGGWQNAKRRTEDHVSQGAMSRQEPQP